MIFEYKCRRCGALVERDIQAYREDELDGQLDRAMTRKQEGLYYPEPNWIFHFPCLPTENSFEVKFRRGTGIADLIGGRNEEQRPTGKSRTS
jgi:hypothetical protein